MNWTTTIADVQHIENTSQYFLLATAAQDYFGASTVFVFDLNAPDSWGNVKIPLTSAPWVSMIHSCAGYEFILTGAEFMHHTWNNGELTEHQQDIVFRSKHLWRINPGKAIYSGGNKLVTVSSQSSAAESFINTPDLNCINGIENNIYVLGGDKGHLLINRGKGWSLVEDIPIFTNIVDIHCVNENEIYICAGYGGVFRWNGRSDWTKYETDPQAFMYSLCNLGGRMCVASLNLKSYWLDGDTSIPMTESTVAHRLKTDGRLLFGLGMNKFEVFDGKTWNIHELDLYKIFPKELEAMYAAAPGP